jgi:hypothetical protein
MLFVSLIFLCMDEMSNVKIPAFAGAASRRQANVKGMSNFKTKKFFYHLGFGFHLAFEL